MLWYSVIKAQKNTPPPPDDHKKHFLAIIAFISLVTSRHPAHCLRRHVNRYLRKNTSSSNESPIRGVHDGFKSFKCAASQHRYLANGVQCPHGSKVLRRLVRRFLAYCLCGKQKKEKERDFQKHSADYIILQTTTCATVEEGTINNLRWVGADCLFFLLLVHCEWIKLDWRPAAAAAWSPSAWAGWGKKSLAGLHIQRSRRFASGSL